MIYPQFIHSHPRNRRILRKTAIFVKKRRIEVR